MAEDTNGANGAATAPQIKMQVLAQFVRDMSFENMVAQKGITGSDGFHVTQAHDFDRC